MIILSFSEKSTFSEQILQRLQDMVVPYQVKNSNDQVDIQLKDGDKTFVGEKAIQTYVDQLAKEITEWRACTCDDWFL